MKIKLIQILAIISMLTISCDKKETIVLDKISIKDLGSTSDTIKLYVGDTIKLSPTIINKKPIKYLWKINNKKISTESNLKYITTEAGEKTIKLTITNNSKSDSKQITVIIFQQAFVTKLIEYRPAPGQFINTSTYGTKEKALKTLKNNKSIITLGAFGGYVSYGFDHNVKNSAGNDIIVYANAFPGNSEQGIVWVMEDKNNNNLPDETWYELAGSDYNFSTTIKNYTVTYFKPSNETSNIKWTDNKGKSGVILYMGDFHKQTHFPKWENDTYSLSGTCIKSKMITENGISKNLNSEWGYVDNYSSEYSTNFGNTFDISWAVDNTGREVNLESIKFIKVQNALLENRGMLGEASTEIKGIADISLLVK